VFSIVTSNYFLRRANKSFKGHPDVKGRFTEVVDDLKKDPFQLHLDLHNLGAKLKGCQTVSLIYGYRITFTLNEKEVILIDIGSHDEVY
jgi:mRNA-degrading endonuclease YafQ of YafQ-DinJ toxin-antitoxin module